MSRYFYVVYLLGFMRFQFVLNIYFDSHVSFTFGIQYNNVVTMDRTLVQLVVHDNINCFC